MLFATRLLCCTALSLSYLDAAIRYAAANMLPLMLVADAVDVFIAAAMADTLFRYAACFSSLDADGNTQRHVTVNVTRLPMSPYDACHAAADADFRHSVFAAYCTRHYGHGQHNTGVTRHAICPFKTHTLMLLLRHYCHGCDAILLFLPCCRFDGAISALQPSAALRHQVVGSSLRS